MQTGEITRRGDLSVADHLDEIRDWLDREVCRLPVFVRFAFWQAG
jgi:hypothetical protein